MNPELERIRDDVKRTTRMADVLRMLGLPEPNRSHKIRSIFNPSERTPSLHVYDYDWFDYSTGEGGDQIDFVKAYLRCSYIEALKILGRGTPMAVKPRFDNNMPYEPSDYTSKFETMPESEDDEVYDLWAKIVGEKWPTLELVDLFAFGVKIHEAGDLWIPHWIPDDKDQLKVRGIKVRHLPDAAKSSVSGSTFTVGLYRPLPTREPRRHAVVVEGESDAWVMAKMLDKRDVTVLALPSGAGALKDRFIDELEVFETVGLAFDADEPGQKARRWFDERLGSGAWDVGVPGGRVAEAAAGGWRL